MSAAQPLLYLPPRIVPLTALYQHFCSFHQITMFAVRLAILLAVCVLVPAVLSDGSITDVEDQIPAARPLIAEDVGYLNNIMDEYRRHINPRVSAEVNAPPQDMYQHYQLWKRNANIINTLLGFPRRMMMAGR